MTDIEIADQITRKLKVRFKELKEISWDSVGYVLNKNKQISKLAFNNIPLKDIRVIIPFLLELTHLDEIEFTDNEIKDITPLNEVKQLKKIKNSS